MADMFRRYSTPRAYYQQPSFPDAGCGCRGKRRCRCRLAENERFIKEDVTRLADASTEVELELESSEPDEMLEKPADLIIQPELEPGVTGASFKYESADEPSSNAQTALSERIYRLLNSGS